MTLPHSFLRCSRRACRYFLVMLLWTTAGVQAQAPILGGGGDRIAQSNAVLAPAPFDLYSGYPNPFNPYIQIRFELHTPVQVQLDVYNLLGQRVQTLMAAWLEADVHEVRWDAREARGVELPSSVLFCTPGRRSRHTAGCPAAVAAQSALTRIRKLYRSGVQ